MSLKNELPHVPIYTEGQSVKKVITDAFLTSDEGQAEIPTTIIPHGLNVVAEIATGQIPTNETLTEALKSNLHPTAFFQEDTGIIHLSDRFCPEASLGEVSRSTKNPGKGRVVPGRQSRSFTNADTN